METAKKLVRQAFLYGLIGGASALLDFLLFTLMYKQFAMNKYLANGISVHAGIAMSFTLNRKYNFKKQDKVLYRAVSFYLTGLFGLALSQGLLWFGAAYLLLPVVMVKFMSVFIVAAVQFTVNKLVAFNN